MTNWFVYLFMFPACIPIASLAMIAGISGTAMLTPFLVLSVPTLTPGQAVGMALFTELFSFVSGVVGGIEAGARRSERIGPEVRAIEGFVAPCG